MIVSSATKRAELVQNLNGIVIEKFKCGLFGMEQATTELKRRREEIGGVYEGVVEHGLVRSKIKKT